MDARLFVCGADVPCTLSRPADIAEPVRNMVEGVDAQAGIVRAGDESIAGAKRVAKYPEVFIPLRFEPVEAGANIEDRLPAGRDGATYVRADGVIRPFQLRRPAN